MEISNGDFLDSVEAQNVAAEAGSCKEKDITKEDLYFTYSINVLKRVHRNLWLKPLSVYTTISV